MNTYAYYASGIFRHTLHSIQAETKREAIEKAKKTPHGITVSTCRKLTWKNAVTVRKRGD